MLRQEYLDGSIVRVTIANVSPTWLAELAQKAGLAGTVFGSHGFGSWGIEQGATVEFAGQDRRDIQAFVEKTLRERGEQAAYMTVEGRAILLWADKEERIA